MLIPRAADIELDRLKAAKVVGLSAGASAPEVLVEEVIAALRRHFTLDVEEVAVRREDIAFNLPRVLAAV
jgi:4-hydroxy-3-methylbut-2-enyl diphosphate reductase